MPGGQAVMSGESVGGCIKFFVRVGVVLDRVCFLRSLIVLVRRALFQARGYFGPCDLHRFHFVGCFNRFVGFGYHLLVFLWTARKHETRGIGDEGTVYPACLSTSKTGYTFTEFR